MEEAYAQAIGGYGEVSARTVAYQIRPRIQALTDKPLDMQYCTQTLIPDYQRRHPGALPGVYYEPRGVLVEPHTGVRVALGTREVEAYVIPTHTYNKILIIEKRGLLPVLQEARLGERYDMALVASEGYATTAARTLLQRADQHERYQIFVVHDADPYGYAIARALREETRRMPGYAVDIIDLGLFYEAAVDMGLGTEEFMRRKALPDNLELSPAARAAFQGRYDAASKTWIATRIELNAMTNEQLVAFIEKGLQDAGAVGKVHPPAEALGGYFQEALRVALRAAFTERILREAGIDEQVEAALATRSVDGAALAGYVTTALRDDPSTHWRAVLQERAVKESTPYR
jgi:hypothetical protein